MASFTITEKGYGLRDMKGQLLPVVVEDLKNGPDQARHAMSVVARHDAGTIPGRSAALGHGQHGQLQP